MNEKTAGDCIGARQSQVDEQLERLERQIEKQSVSESPCEENSVVTCYNRFFVSCS